MSKRNYNVFFNTHTVSGIVISVALYVIFFAGAFALFKDEINVWEKGESISHTKRSDINYDKIFNTLDEAYELKGRDIQLDFGGETDEIYAYLLPSQDSTATEKGKTTHYFSVDINTLKRKEYHEHYGIGEFLYRLHFFHQLPIIGVYLAGFVSLFFLFAIVTGVIVHWKKIIPNFYTFNPKIALKRVWTDAHTALGTIGLPFQFIFAITGAYFALSILVLIPANFLYNGDQTKLLEDLRPDRKTYAWESAYEGDIPSFNSYVKKAANTWEDFHITRAFVRNYGGTNMKYVILGEMEDDDRFIGNGSIVYNAITGTIEVIKNPTEVSYTEDVQLVLTRLHFANFGGLAMRIAYFILALITCFVILSGVLIWIEARNKKSMTIRQRLYTAKVGHIYLAICLSMLPVTAISFLFVKLFGSYYTDKQTTIYYFYFLLWLVTILYMRFKRDNYFVNKMSLLVGGIAGLLIPIANGLVSGQWIWTTIQNKQHDILLVDMLWLFIGITSLLVYKKITKKVQEQSTFTKAPIDFKNFKALLKEEQITNQTSEKTKDKNFIPMRTKIIALWTLIVIGFIIHHVYGLASIYFNESVMIEGSTGEIPGWVHQWRIILEGMAFLFAVLTIQVSKQWFRWTSFIWAILLGLFNVYHFITAVIYEASNVSEILILLLMVVANLFLIKELLDWKSTKNTTA
ncbi:PepSY-associated TM helix domain-containing protein [Tenacibaculum amylolyticum]|uniref:PepSY-associated TM helix domain-containing protein n=1 Tax=Tenacibaculum amylolyticum TaxID=104269 RepID=UPI003893CC78